MDVPAVARDCGLRDETLYVEDINEHVNPSSPYPVPKDFNMLIRTSVMPQDHLNYTITWYFIISFLLFNFLHACIYLLHLAASRFISSYWTFV